MKGVVSVLVGAAVGLFSYDVIWAVIRERFDWTTLGQLFEVAGVDRQVPEFVQGTFAAPALLAFLLPAIAFYLLILWLDFS